MTPPGFAVNAIRRWWQTIGMRTLPPTQQDCVINADCGGSNGARVRLWKRELQALANELGIAITVCHLPPGTSKWNKIEHRLFSFITQNWKSRPLSATRPSSSSSLRPHQNRLEGASEIDTNTYPAGIKVTDAEMNEINIRRHEFHGEWNYTISPNQPKRSDN